MDPIEWDNFPLPLIQVNPPAISATDKILSIAYKNGVLTSAYVNGTSVGTLTAVTTGKSYDTLALGEGPFGLEGSCNVNESVIFPTALTNAELASLTTI